MDVFWDARKKKKKEKKKALKGKNCVVLNVSNMVFLQVIVVGAAGAGKSALTQMFM